MVACKLDNEKTGVHGETRVLDSGFRNMLLFFGVYLDVVFHEVFLVVHYTVQ